MWSRLKSSWLRLLLVFGLVVGSVVFTLAWWVGGKLVAPANRPVGRTAVQLPIEDVRFESDSGASVAGWYVRHPSATATVVLLHAMRGDRRAMLRRASLLHGAGYSSLLVDLQAHGESRGETITFGFLERFDAQAAVEFARSENPDHKIFVIGRSLGGAAALLGTPLSVDAIVVESVYPTILEATKNRMARRLGAASGLAAPVLLMQLYPRLGIWPSELRPIDRIAEVGCPILVMSGGQDRHTTWADTLRLYDAALEPKQLVNFEGATHQDLQDFDPERYGREILTFLNQAR